ncbi:hypothetical protein MRX96_050341 [Rhipicephalus microplus]
MSKVKEATRPPTLGRQSRPRERDKYAEKVIASMTRTSKMPNVVPRDGIKIFVRRRGGLNIPKLQVTAATAIRQAAGVSREDGKTDKFCPMVYLNVVVVNAQDKRRDWACVRLKFIRAGDQVHERGRSKSREHVGWTDAVKGGIRRKEPSWQHSLVPSSVGNSRYKKADKRDEEMELLKETVVMLTRANEVLNGKIAKLIAALDTSNTEEMAIKMNLPA